MEIGTYNEHPQYKVKDVSVLLEEVERFVPIHYQEISVAFVTEATICQLHRQFLQTPDATDVITFPSDEAETYRTGEICISIDEALKYDHLQSLTDELTLYLVHGWLHLAGYDDIAESDRVIMRQMEQKVLAFLDTQAQKRVQVCEKPRG